MVSLNPKYAALFTSMNLLLGVGPLIIPQPFFTAGFGLSTIWLVIVFCISYNSARYVTQAIAKVSRIVYLQEKQSTIIESDEIDNNSQQNLAMHVNTEKEQIPNNQNLNSNSQLLQKPAIVYDHAQQFKILFGKKWMLVPSIVVSIYLAGVSISKCIMTGKTLSQVFDNTILLQQFYFWMGVFFISGGVFSFKSIQKTVVMQSIIFLIRFISIGLMIFGAIYLILKNGQVARVIPKQGSLFDFSNFSQIFSNTVFSIMFHHSLPGICSQVKNTESRNFFVRYAFLISGTTTILISYTAIMAFGQSLVDPSQGAQGLKYYNFAFQQSIPFIYYFVSFYVFLNIAAFAVYIIVIRTNLMRITVPHIDSKKLSKQTGIVTLILLTIILACSWFLKDNIETVLQFTGGIFGCSILFYIPAIQVFKSRQMTYSQGSTRNYIRYLPIVIMILGTILMCLNLYQSIKKLL